MVFNIVFRIISVILQWPKHLSITSQIYPFIPGKSFIAARTAPINGFPDISLYSGNISFSSNRITSLLKHKISHHQYWILTIFNSSGHIIAGSAPMLNPFPNDKVWTLPNWKSLQRQFQMGWKWQKVLQTGRKHCGKRRNCLLRAISPFPTVFAKGLYCRHVKTRACLGKG